MLPYFVRSENNQDLPASVYHGRGGRMNVRRPARPNRLNADFIAATQSLGFPLTTDFTGADSEGVGLRQGVIRGGRRESTARAYLRPALRRGNISAAAPMRWRCGSWLRGPRGRRGVRAGRAAARSPRRRVK